MGVVSTAVCAEGTDNPFILPNWQGKINSLNTWPYSDIPVTTHPNTFLFGSRSSYSSPNSSPEPLFRTRAEKSPTDNGKAL
jgi:hypothetical protein